MSSTLMQQHAFLLFVATLSFMAGPSMGRRYRLCQEGCCIHEYCAYNIICYPRIHCHFGCPDGYCAGTGNTYHDDAKNSRQLNLENAPKRNVDSSQRVDGGSAQITENYSHSDRLEKKINAKERPLVQVSESIGNSHGNNPEGICMPLPPCKKNEFCGMGHSCTLNFNLGYEVCQYNLDIGTTLCYDTHGHFVTKPRK